MRVDRPIGTVLVLMPTLWSLWIASSGKPSFLNVFIFTAGCFLMRSAGCVMNDIADRSFDPLVARTKSRPIAAGEVSVKEGVLLFLLLAILSFLLILSLNRLTILLSAGGLILAIFYPFSKRFISLPQFVLGISFGWGAIMAWAAVRNRIELPATLIFSANIFWSMAYDTIYALMDREDDLKAGVKSSAILLGKHVWLGVAFFLSMVLILLAITGWIAQIHPVYFVMLALTGIAFLLQVNQLKKNDSPDLAFRLFKHHGLLGILILSGIVSAYLFQD